MYVRVRVSVCVCVSRAVLLYSPVCGVCIVSYCCPVRGVSNRPLHIQHFTLFTHICCNRLYILLLTVSYPTLYIILLTVPINTLHPFTHGSYQHFTSFYSRFLSTLYILLLTVPINILHPFTHGSYQHFTSFYSRFRSTFYILLLTVPINTLHPFTHGSFPILYILTGY